MPNPIRVYRTLLSTMLLALILGSPLFMADVLAQDKPLAWVPNDSELEWGSCPEFMPESCEIAVLQGDPATPNTDVFFKMAPNTTVPRHRHSSVERMVLVSGEMHVTYDGHETAVLTPGTYAYGPAEMPHKASCADGDDCVLFIAFEQPVDAMPAEGPASN